MPRTRFDLFCPVFGAPKPFSDNMLPTYFDVMKYYLLIREKLLETSKQEPSLSVVCVPLIQDLKSLWEKSSISVVSDQQILHQIRQYYNKYRNIKKRLKRDGKLSDKANVVLFRNSAEKKLFDVSLCKCKDFIKCACKTKVPVAERHFLLDQRTTRKMAIGNIDAKVSKILLKKLERKTKEEERKKRHLLQETETDNQSEVSSSSSKNSDIIDKEYSHQTNSKSSIEESCPSTSQMRLKLPSLAQACDRTGVSDRSAAIIVNAALTDMGILTKEDPSKIVDRSKIRRERTKARSDLKRKDNETSFPLYGLYFDGRKDQTIIQVKDENRFSRKTITEEHIVLVSEPGSMYLGHVTPSSGHSTNIKRSILEFLEKNMDLSKLQAIGCDGTVVNTGVKNGILRQIEVSLGRPLQWFVCLLHANELPLRHLLQNLDGSTTGPKGYSGEIGKQLEKCEKMPVRKFEKIETTLPAITPSELSTDQQYLYEICTAISSGNISLSLSQRGPGKLNHSRWLTTANRILRLYVATENPSTNLKILTQYIMKVYAVSWFEIKSKPSCRHGSKHFFGIIQKSRFLPAEIKNIIDPVIQRNGYFSHPENMLLAMLADSRKTVRELGLRRLLKCRQHKLLGPKVREFRVPLLNFKATDYIDLIDWQSVTIIEPPLTVSISDSSLMEMISEVPSEIGILKFPCHSQAVERCVKLVTEASTAVCGFDARDGYIRSKIASRAALPIFETKSQYYKVLEK